MNLPRSNTPLPFTVGYPNHKSRNYDSTVVMRNKVLTDVSRGGKVSICTCPDVIRYNFTIPATDGQSGDVALLTNVLPLGNWNLRVIGYDRLGDLSATAEQVGRDIKITWNNLMGTGSIEPATDVVIEATLY